MGGRALIGITPTRRYQAEEYHALCNEIALKLISLGYQYAIIPAYSNKESFGDMDILIVANHDSKEQPRAIMRKLNVTSHAGVTNSNVHSFAYKELQIDLIFVQKKWFQSSLDYYRYNDLGNLLGRIAHKMGFKYGHDGLTAVVRIGDHVLKEISISTDTRKILKFLGYDPLAAEDGFANLEDIFEFVVSGKFFHPDIYLLHNRNNVSRVRDAKRPTYTAFLKWCENMQNDPFQDQRQYYQWEDISEKGGRRLTEEWINRADEFFGKGQKLISKQIRETYILREKVVASHAKWSGGSVMERTGLQGKELGNLITKVKQLLIEQCQIGECIHDVVLRLDDSIIHEMEQTVLKEIGNAKSN